MKKTIIFLGLLTMAGFVSPDLVDTKQTTDDALSCEQLMAEISQLDAKSKDVQKEKGFTGTNVAAGLLFWPGLIATHCNVNDAQRSYNDRKCHLVDLYNRKCAHKKKD